MRRSFAIWRLSAVLLMGVAILAGASITASAQPYTQLQVLLPGETASPGGGSGKSGTPDQQTVGVPFTVTVRACDASWNTVTSITNSVSFASSDGSASLPGNISLSSGVGTAQVTLNAAGSFTVSATDESDGTISEATSSAMTVLLLDGFAFSKINQKNQYAGVPMPITVTAVDPGGATVTGYSGLVNLEELTSYGVGRIEPAVITMSNGTWSGSVTMYRADQTSINRGNVNVSAYLASNTAINGISDPFTVHPGAFSQVQIVVPGQDPTPGNVNGTTGTPASQSAGNNFTVSIYSTDDYWNPVPSGDNVRITSDDTGASTPVNATLVNGFAQATLSLGTVGTQHLTVTDQTNGSIQGMTSDGIPVIASAPDHFEIDTITGPITAGATVSVTIRATDVGGNTITDFSGDGILSANTGAGSISPNAITFTNGVWTGDMVFRGAGGAVSFSCADFSSPPHIGTSNSFQVVPDAYVGLQVVMPGQTPAGGTASGVTGTPDQQQAGTSFNLTVRAVDQFWNRVPGITNRVGLSSTDLFAGMPSDTSLVNGELVFPITLYRSGMQSVTAEDLDAPSTNPHTSSLVEVIGGPYSRIVLIAPGESIAPGTAEGRSGTPTDQSINFAFTVTVYATDEWFNPVPGVTDLIRITCEDPLAELPPDANMIDGVVDMTMRLSTGGFSQITAENLTQPSMPTSTTDVNAISSGFHLEADVSPTNVRAGDSFTLTVRVTNDAGSTIQEINSFVTVDVQNASTEEPGRGDLTPTTFQLLQGERAMQLTYTFAEPIILIVSDDAGNAPAATEVITVTPGVPARVDLTSNPTWVPGNRHAALSATVYDAYDNGVPGEPVSFALISGDGVLTPIDGSTGSTGAAAADFLSPRLPGFTLLRATSNGLTDDLNLETALVDPDAKGGHITNYPNPFHPGEQATTIAYKLDDNAHVTLRIYTLTGGLVYETEMEKGQPGGRAGLNEFQWNGRNGDNTVVASGGYVVYILADGNGETLHKMRRKIGVVR